MFIDYVKKDKTKPFRAGVATGPTDPESPTNPIGPTAEEMVMNCAISKLKADRTPIPDNRFTLPPEYGVDGGGFSDRFNGHEYVDLGLPSGTLWAKMNVGASSEKDAGLYFAWGETQGYTASQVPSDKKFSWSDYALTEDRGSTMSKYNASDNKTHLELTDDAAAANMGGDWHMPNRAQHIELFKETKNGFVTNQVIIKGIPGDLGTIAGAFTQYAWSDSNGYSSPTSTTATISNWDTAGYFFFKNSYTSVTDAISAEDYLFVPAAGSYEDGEVYDVGYGGRVWASALDSESVRNAWYFGFDSDRAGVDYGYRYVGQSVRGVVGQMDEITDETTPDDGESHPK